MAMAVHDLMAALRRTTHFEASIDDDQRADDLADGSRRLSIEVELLGPTGAMASGVMAYFDGIVLDPVDGARAAVWMEAPDGMAYLGRTVDTDEYGTKGWEGEERTDSLVAQVGLMCLAYEVGISATSQDRLSLEAISSAARQRVATRSAMAYEGVAKTRPREDTLWTPLFARRDPGSHARFLMLVEAAMTDCAVLAKGIGEAFDPSHPNDSIEVTTPGRLGELFGVDSVVVDRAGELTVTSGSGQIFEVRTLPVHDDMEYQGLLDCDLRRVWEAALQPHLADELATCVEGEEHDQPDRRRERELGDGNPPLSTVVVDLSLRRRGVELEDWDGREPPDRRQDPRDDGGMER